MLPNTDIAICKPVNMIIKNAIIMTNQYHTRRRFKYQFANLIHTQNANLQDLRIYSLNFVFLDYYTFKTK